MENQPIEFTGVYSCESSRQAGEHLFASATRVDVWLLLEYNRPYGAEAFAESDLPVPVKDHLSQALAAIPRSRLQLIKQGRESRGDIAFFLGLSREADSQLYRFPLTSYDDLLELDLGAIVIGDSAYNRFLHSEPLYIVCTNGKRDLCCARHGLPLYQKIASHVGDAVWQTSHIGGHRFAGTMVCLPEGLCYGRLDSAYAKHIVSEHRSGRVAHERYRGRSCYDEAIQAADYFAREQSGLLGIHDLRLEGVKQTDDNLWTVRFASNAQVHTVQVARAMSDFQIVKTTGDKEKSSVYQYRLFAYALDGGSR